MKAGGNRASVGELAVAGWCQRAMATRQEKFRQAALSYLVYGGFYLAGAMYITMTGVVGRAVTWQRGSTWFGIGAILVLLFPWLISRGYVWFTRLLAVLVLFRAVGVALVMLKPTIPVVPLPGGIELPMRAGAFFFLLMTLGTDWMLVRAAWDLKP